MGSRSEELLTVGMDTLEMDTLEIDTLWMDTLGIDTSVVLKALSESAANDVETEVSAKAAAERLTLEFKLDLGAFAN